MTVNTPTTRLFVNRTLDAPETVPVAGGVACVFSAVSPAKDTDNEDAAAVIAVGGERTLLAVADGCGGMAAGAKASAMAIETLAETAGAADDATPLRTVVLAALELANERILALGIGAATTVAVVGIEDNGARPYHVGDSEILLVGQRGKVKMQIVPHSLVGYAVEAGLLEAAEAMHHKERHVVLNTLGFDDMRIEIGGARPVSARDTLLVASDGVFDNLLPAEVIDLVRTGPIEKATTDLAAAAHRRMTTPEPGQPSKPDDLTFVVYRRR